jgi:hypothetical protein
MVVTDPLSIEMLMHYRAADDRKKAAMRRILERMAVEKMPFEIAASLYRLEIAGVIRTPSRRGDEGDDGLL